MPQVNIQGVGSVNFPDSMTPDEITHAIETEILPQAKPEPTPIQSVRGSIPGRFMQGAADPALGILQLASHIPGVDRSQQLAERQKADLRFQGINVPDALLPRSVDDQLSQNEASYQQARKATGSDGLDVSRFAGNVVSPVNAGIAKIAPVFGNTLLRRAATGAVAGAMSGAATPITDPESQKDFLATKATQTGIGAFLGAVLTPIVSKVGEAVTRVIGNKLSDANASQQTNQIIAQALKETGQKPEDLPPSFLENLQNEVNNSLRQGKELDAAALLRQKDFESLGLPSTQGQILRDATQFAKEKNLRGIANAGEPLQRVFDAQNKGLTDKLSSFAGDASESYSAGQKLADALRSTDQNLSNQVRSAYEAARASAGRDLEVPMQGLAQDVGKIIKDYGESNVPAAVRSRLGEFGVFGDKQSKLFTVNDAEQLLQQINKVYNPMNKAEAGALNELRTAVKNAVSAADDSGGVFSEARQLAAKRFTLQDAIPALKASADGSVNPDTFVNKYLVNGRTDQVQLLAKLLKSTSPDAYEEARNQIGNRLYRAAFGENVAGDKLFRPEEFSKTVRAIGPEKLKAFFSQAEIDQLKTIGRVGSYINSTPTSAPVNFSNTAGAAANLAQQALPGKASILAGLLRSVKNVQDVNSAVSPKIPMRPAPLSLDETSRELLARSLLLGSTGVSGALVPRN